MLGRTHHARCGRWLPLVGVLAVLASSWLWPRFAWAGEVLAHERYRLSNGLDVVLHVDRQMPLVAVNLGYHVGTMHDGEHPGLAHLVEHLMFRGTRHMDDGELARRLFEAGAVGTNASTRYDHTSYYTVVPAQRLALVLWLESDRMAHMAHVLTEATVAQEVRTTIDEWEDRVQSERDGLAGEAMWNTLFPPGHPFHRVAPEQIGTLRRAHVDRFVRRHYGPANATLVLAGDLPADVREMVERYLGHRSGGVRPPEPPGLVRISAGPQTIERTSPLATAPSVWMAWLTAGLYEPGDAEADVLAATLEAGRLTAMAEQEAPGVFADIHAAQYSRHRQSVFILAARGVPEAQPPAMLAAIEAVLDRLRADGLRAGDVRRARRRLSLDVLRGLQRVEGRAGRMQLYVGAGKDPDWLDEDLARYAAVDEVGVATFLRDELVDDRRVVMLLRPEESP